MSTKFPDHNTRKVKVPFIVQYFDPATRAKDPSDHDLDDILNYSDNQISRKHDFIQYLFPLPEESMVNPWAPLITKDVYIAFRDREDLRKELLQALLRMLEFYGLTFSAPEGEGGGRKIVPGPNFAEQSKYSWRRSMDHNHLRLTRMIRCLRVLSCEQEAKALYGALLEHEGGAVSRSSKMFWGRAANRPLWLPPDEPDDDAGGIRWLREVSEAQAENAATDEASAGGQTEGDASGVNNAVATSSDGTKDGKDDEASKGKLS